MKFLTITKPGIIFGNIVTLAGGFFLATQAQFNFSLLIISMLAMSLIIACGCVYNNCIDRDIDPLMQRTKDRPIVIGSITVKVALWYGTALGLLGFALLYYLTNPLTTIVAFIGLFFYVVVYSLWLKRRSIYGTIIGGVAGAVPPVVGYCAVTGRFDTGALLLFLILFTWQIPHFYAISIYRLNDFKAAAIPILPVQKNIHYTKMSMLMYIVAFFVTAIMPSLFGYAGLAYFITACLTSVAWLALGIYGFFAKDELRWARSMFLLSIIIIMLLCVMMLNH